MDPTAKAIFFLAALVIALVAAVWDYAQAGKPTVTGLLSAAFAVFTVPFMWDAFEAS